MTRSNSTGLICVMLAAGESSRMGKWKMTLPWNGSTIIEESVSAAQAAGLDVIIAAGYKAEELARVIEASSRIDRSRCRLVSAGNYMKGMFASARAGFAAAAEKAPQWCCLALGDMPLVRPEMYRLLGAYAQDGAAWHTAIPQYRGKKGHPLLLDSTALSFALNLTDDHSMRDVISAFPSITVPVEDRGVLNDIDTPDDYRNFNE